MNHSLAVSFLCAALVTSITAGCAPPGVDPSLESAADDADASSQTVYVELNDFLVSEADAAAWLELRSSLAQSFDDVCGDTFCEGDYSNLTSLDFNCSVSSKIGKVRECAWTFAASDERVSANTGEVAATVPFFICRVTPQAKAGELLTALANDPLHAALPGLEQSLYDALSECFNAPQDLESLPAPTEGPFHDVADTLADEEIDAWYGMLRGIREDFDQRCGDSFCEGEFTNLTSLRFRCSEDANGSLASCSWSFAGSDSSPKKNGKLRIDRDATTCTFAVSGTPLELAAALANECAGPSPLLRPLPGSESTLYDSLGDCL
jgi:hypothetical protein